MSEFRRTRPPGQMPEVILHLLIINALFYFAMQVPQLKQYENLLIGYSIFSPEFKPWQIITHFFMHANTSHLFFNMFGLWMFGRILSSVWDNKRFLFFYFTCAMGSFLLHQVYLFYHYGTNPPIEETGFLGASGAVYGVLAAFGTLFPNSTVMLLIPPIPMKAKYMVVLLVAIDFIMGLSGAHSGIAHFAHLGGAITGFLLVKYWQKNAKSFY